MLHVELLPSARDGRYIKYISISISVMPWNCPKLYLKLPFPCFFHNLCAVCHVWPRL